MAKTGLKEQVRLDTSKLLPPRRSPADVDEVKFGKPLDLAGLRKSLDMEQVLRHFLGKRDLKSLHLDEAGFLRALKETEKRLSGQKATVDQLVGTFLEVVGPHHPIALEIRLGLVDANVDAAVFAALSGDAVFIRAGTSEAPKSLRSHRESLPMAEKRKATEVEMASVAESRIDGVKKGIDPDSIMHMRDLEIDNLEFSDRAVLMALPGGRWLLLLTEEYKTPGSGGVNAQTAVRDNRLFNDGVSAASTLRCRDAKGNVVTIALGDLLVNVATNATDKVAIKAATRTRYQQRTPRVTRAIKDRKEVYGDLRRLNSEADVSFVFLGLKYPSDKIRRFMEFLWRQSAPAPASR